MSWNIEQMQPVFDVADEIAGLRRQIFNFITSFTPDFYISLFLMATIAFIVYLWWYVRYAIKEASKVVSK